MIPRNFSTRVLLVFAVVMLSVVPIHFSDNASATQAGRFGYCTSGPDQTEVYVSEAFNTGLNPAYVIDTTAIRNEYNEYLKGRFDFKSNSSFPVSCPVFETIRDCVVEKFHSLLQPNHIPANRRNS